MFCCMSCISKISVCFLNLVEKEKVVVINACSVPFFLFHLAIPVSRFQFHAEPTAGSQVPPPPVWGLPTPEIASVLYDLNPGKNEWLAENQITKNWAVLVSKLQCYLHGSSGNQIRKMSMVRITLPPYWWAFGNWEDHMKLLSWDLKSMYNFLFWPRFAAASIFGCRYVTWLNCVESNWFLDNFSTPPSKSEFGRTELVFRHTLPSWVAF